ncbi:MAG TPA: HAD family phosphatase [Lentisphaeria bacterium]|nr:MAG: haloacid dehalogenase [Lentisphaerae bacterium GWF2_38_69]HBM14745.1 HAD family phosphatase [Lentisphaeria bacterium]
MLVNKKYTGVVFDFNGTLFWDTKLHNKSWDIFLSKRNMIPLSDEEKMRKIHGKNSEAIFNMLFNKVQTKEQIRELVLEKESIYQGLCLESKLTLASGAIEFFEFLKTAKVSYTIATASEQYNVKFFIKLLNLEKWFDLDKVVYDDGMLKGKPDPQVFLKAMHEIGKSPDEVIIFEDSIAGITAAERAKAGKIIIVNSNNDDYSSYEHDIITNFNQVGCSLFL